MKRIIAAAASALALTGATLLGPVPIAVADDVPTFETVAVTATGCQSADYTFTMESSGFGGDSHTIRTVAVAGGEVYMSEAATRTGDGQVSWSLFDLGTYSPTSASWPIPAAEQLTITFTVERPQGNVLSSWTTVVKNCESSEMLYNGPTSDDGDRDFVPILQDLCPTLQASTANGCPVIDRSLTIKAGKGLVRGKLVSASSEFVNGATVTVWKVKKGKDPKVRTVKVQANGVYKVKVKPGRYYATAPATTIPTLGFTAADKTGKVKVKK